MLDFKVAAERLALVSPAVGGTVATLADHGTLSGTTTNRWTAQSSVDFRRSALETFHSMRACGAVTVRNWLNQSYGGYKRSNVLVDVWTLTTTLDYPIAECALMGDAAVINLLNSDDTVEISFRRLASFVYVDRTGDQAGGMRMLGVSAPGTKVDVALGWLVEESTLFSKMEHQRGDRLRKPRGDGKQDSKGKGKGAKGADNK